MITKVAVIGSSGQLGTDLVKAFDAVPLTHEDVEVADHESLDILRDIKPDVVINAAAYVRVDDAEVEAQEAFRTNAVGALNVARACDEIGAVNVYISTDYVFDGKRGDTIIKEAREEGAVRIVDDIFMSPANTDCCERFVHLIL